MMSLGAASSIIGPASFIPLSSGLLQAATTNEKLNRTFGDEIRKFNVDVPQEELTYLKQRLSQTRWPEKEPVSDWSQGVPLSKIQYLCEYWQKEYDWRRCEEMINNFGSYTTKIKGLDIHFLHIRSSESNALPLLLLHGWPGSILEFHKIIGPLTNPNAYGKLGENVPESFHLVIPSMPGYGFSEKPDETGWNRERIADAWIELMSRLGYGDYWAAHGGDWGELIAMTIGNKAPKGLIGVHVSTIDLTPNSEEIEKSTSTELSYIEKANHFLHNLSGYAKEQATKPQTIGYALADSPVGQAAWIYEKFYDWTDNDGSPERILSLDEMIDNIMMYWLPNTGASSARLYRENADVTWGSIPVNVPVGVSQFPKDVTGGSRRWADERFNNNVVYWNDLAKGGHFAALEQPGILIDEIRKCFRLIRKNR
ncbi:Pimeloyl-ACP methyl ester carboxylesterase [Pedobacter caeni]|uniref:Pimeloyl-ACP methyl ester carboxylesterase n=2 Tax=Pedobacter caeni TaxID=288992 RepID=A0A1M5GMB6_9SPHI|nr:Pimeloyl-ACP methyl ester carboxylesterase [Pedobacter caeni]